MKITTTLRTLLVSAAGAAWGFGWSADKLCPTAVAPFAHPGGPLALAPLVNLQDSVPQPINQHDLTSAMVRSMVLFKLAEPLKQVPIDDAVKEAKKIDVSLKFSSAEQFRQQHSESCKTAYVKLRSTFAQMHASFKGLAELPEESALQRFVAWWVAPETTPAQRAAAQPVLDAQRVFDGACLSKDIPAEMGPDAVKATVGVLVFDDGMPFCAAFRTANSKLLTARHCFVNGEGDLWDNIRALAAPNKRLWFLYPAEPSHRFEVCKSSVPSENDGIRLYPERDRINLSMATTAAPVPQWEWADAKPGASLYVRGYFAFGTEATPLERLRGSAAGGCAALVIKGKCVLNGCQSLPTSSGAPVFLRPEPGGPSGPLRVVGLHLGSADYADTASSEACPTLLSSDLPSGNVAFQFREN